MMEEYLKSLKVVILKKLSTNFSITGLTKKREYIEALLDADLELDEVKEWCEEFDSSERERARLADSEAQKRQADLQREERLEQRAHELELARIANNGNRNLDNDNQVNNHDHNNEKYDMSKFLRPFKEDGDLGLFLVNFERVCSQLGFTKDSWSLKLMTVIPPKAAEVIARLSERDASNYDIAKSSLMAKYQLNADSYRLKFRNKKKQYNESFGEHGYLLKANLCEWIKAEHVDEEYEKLLQLVCLEQFYSTLTDDMKFWVEDRNDLNTIEKAAELADEYHVKRNPNHVKSKGSEYKRKHYQGEQRFSRWQKPQEKGKSEEKQSRDFSTNKPSTSLSEC